MLMAVQVCLAAVAVQMFVAMMMRVGMFVAVRLARRQLLPPAQHKADEHG